MPKVPTSASAFTVNDAIVVLDTTKVYADDHPWVKAHPELFTDLDLEVVEAATAAPGERRRGPGRPPKAAEPKK